MKKEAVSQKAKKNPSKPKPDVLKPMAIKMKKKLQVEKQKNSSKPETDLIKPKTIKRKK